VSQADEDEFREFVSSRSPALLRTAYLLTGDHGHAEDLVQIALTRAHRHWGRVRAAANPEAYVRKILVNERRSWWRQLRNREIVLERMPQRVVVDEQSAVAERDAIWRAVLAMPPRVRAVLVLRYWEDLSVQETASILGCSVGTVKSQAFRGLRRLHDLLDPDGLSTGRGPR
jgi:RNA polymerase sigma-70 factor (sigma-E family)